MTGITAAHIPIQKAEYRAPRGAGRPSKMRHLGKPVGGGGKFYDIYILEYIIILYHKKSNPPPHTQKKEILCRIIQIIRLRN